MRFNVLGCFLVLAMSALTTSGAGLTGQPDRFYRLNGYGVSVALLLLVVWVLFSWQVRGRADST
jgi:hypothetical protein